MKFRTLTPVHYTGSNETILYKSGRFTFTNDLDVVKKHFQKEKFISFLGTLNHKTFVENHYFFIISESKLEENDPVIRTSKLTNALEHENGTIFVMLSSLWFFYDNNIFNTVSYLYDELLDEYISNTRAIMLSNSSGAYEPCGINNEIVMALLKMTSAIIPFRNADLADTNKGKSDIKGFGAHVGDISGIDFGKTSRIFRAITFLDLARSQSFLPLKISMYVGIFECLFTTESTEVSHKVAENAAFYISNTNEERAENYALIKKAYDIRSKYLHGQRLDKQKHKSSELLTPISKEIDKLLRLIFVQIITQDSEVFLKSDNDLRIHFMNLIFGLKND